MRADLPPGPSYPSLMHAIGFWTRPLAWLERNRARYGKRFTTRFPLSPYFVIISDPDELKQVFTAPPDVLHPGQGARILEPIVGKNSVLLLDEDAHMSQRKLMLPAFHGKKMAALDGLMTEVAEREVASWPARRADRAAPADAAADAGDHPARRLRAGPRPAPGRAARRAGRDARVRRPADQPGAAAHRGARWPTR